MVLSFDQSTFSAEGVDGVVTSVVLPEALVKVDSAEASLSASAAAAASAAAC